MFTAILKPSALINTFSLCSVMRQPYDFTYPRPWSESLQTADSDELIIPLSCNYPPPPSPSFSLSILILLFPSQSLLSFVFSLLNFCLFLFHKLTSTYITHTYRPYSFPQRLHLICHINTISSLYILFFVNVKSAPLSLPAV